MRLLALDISTKTGWAIFQKEEDGQFRLLDYGLIELGKPVVEFGDFPFNHVDGTKVQAENIIALVEAVKPDEIVIEQTNLGRQRMSQKILEFIHCHFLAKIRQYVQKVFYIDSSAWRKNLALQLTIEDKKNNNRLSAAKTKAKRAGAKLDKKELGIKGRINKKHLAIRYVNDRYNLSFKMKDNDIADAICVGTAYLNGCDVNTGKTN